MSFNLTSNFFGNARGLTFTDGGGVTWTLNPSTNSVTAAVAGSGISSITSTGGDLAVSGSGTIDLELKTQPSVTGGAYTYASITVNAKGVITAVSNGTAPVTSVGSSNLTVGGSGSAPTINLSSTQVTNIGLGGTALQSVSGIDSLTGAGTSASPLQLSGDSAAPGNSFYYGTNSSGTKGWFASIAAPVGANPSGSVGLSAVNGSAATFMRSDAAPALSVSIAPTWTGAHTFNQTVTLAAANGQLTMTGDAIVEKFVNTGAAANNGRFRWVINDSGGMALQTLNDAESAASNVIFVQRSGTTVQTLTYGNSTDNPTHQFFGKVGFNGVTPAAQSTGYGTPTGNAKQASFAASTITLPNLAAAVAQLIIDLKATGLIAT